MLSWLTKRFAGDENSQEINNDDSFQPYTEDEEDLIPSEVESYDIVPRALVMGTEDDDGNTSTDDQEVTITDMRNHNYKIQENYDPDQQPHILQMRSTRSRSTSNASGHSGSSSTTLSGSNLEDYNMDKNPFTEVHVINAEHIQKDIMTKMIPLFDENDVFYNITVPPTSAVGGCLVASCNDDGSIAVWDMNSGKKVFLLAGHRLPVKCATLIRNPQHVTQNVIDHDPFKKSTIQSTTHNQLLISGSSDKMIKIWDLSDGRCIQTLTEHTGSVRCICLLDNDRFCSAGNDTMIHVWNSGGELLGSIQRKDDDNIHQLIALSNNRIVVASDNNVMYIYDTVSFTRVETSLKEHQESVQCLIKIDDKSFASASIDGAIMIWDSSLMQSVKKLNEPSPATPSVAIVTDEKSETVKRKTDSVRTPDETSNHNSDSTVTILSHQPKFKHVRHLGVINTKYLSAAIGNGLYVYDLENAQCVFKIEDAHDADVVKIISLHHGNVLVSCSDDGGIKVWNTFSKFPAPAVKSASSPASPRSAKKENKQKNKVYPHLLGDLPLHTEAVHDLLPLSPYSFASCGADKLIMVWKDTRLEKRIRSFYAYKHQTLYANHLQNISNGYVHTVDPLSVPRSPISSRYIASFSPHFFSPILSGRSMEQSPLIIQKCLSENDLLLNKRSARRKL